MLNLENLKNDENVLDLYCGAGAISIYISHMVNKVSGIEMNDGAIEMAKENAILNNIYNCDFLARDVKEYLHSVIPLPHDVRDKLQQVNRNINQIEYNTIILDPPRSGIHPKSAEYILALEPKKIIYVSCNPATQARDIKLLEEKYDITSIQPVDMFPHTFHIENVVRLDRK